MAFSGSGSALPAGIWLPPIPLFGANESTASDSADAALSRTYRAGESAESPQFVSACSVRLRRRSIACSALDFNAFVTLSKESEVSPNDPKSRGDEVDPNPEVFPDNGEVAVPEDVVPVFAVGSLVSAPNNRSSSFCDSSSKEDELSAPSYVDDGDDEKDSPKLPIEDEFSDE